MSDVYTERMSRVDQALSEGCCPLCGERLTPVDGDADAAGLCMDHGLFEIRGDQWIHTHPAGLGWVPDPPRIPTS